MRDSIRKKIALALACASGLGGKTLAINKNQSQNEKPLVTFSGQINKSSNKGGLNWVKNHWPLVVGGSLMAALVTVLTVVSVKYLGKNNESQELNNKKNKNQKKSNNLSKLNNGENNDKDIKIFENKTKKEEIQGKTFYELLQAEANKIKEKYNGAKELLDVLYAFLRELSQVKLNSETKTISPRLWKLNANKNKTTAEKFDTKHIFELLDFLSGKQRILDPEKDFDVKFKKGTVNYDAQLSIVVNHTNAQDEYDYQFINVTKSYVSDQISISYSPNYKGNDVFKFEYPFKNA